MQFVAIAIVDFYDYLTKEMIVPHRKAIPKLHTQSQFDTDALSAHKITVFMFPFVPSFYFHTHTHRFYYCRQDVCMFISNNRTIVCDDSEGKNTKPKS